MELIESSDRKRVDRIMSVYIRPWYDEAPDNNTNGTFAVPEEYKKTPSISAVNFEAVISSTPGEDNIGSNEYNTESTLPESLYEGYYNYGYSINLPIVWEEIKNGTSIFYNPQYHPEYEDIPLWGIEEINIDPNDTISDNTVSPLDEKATDTGQSPLPLSLINWHITHISSIVNVIDNPSVLFSYLLLRA